jgi:hypothetical protein
MVNFINFEKVFQSGKLLDIFEGKVPVELLPIQDALLHRHDNDFLVGNCNLFSLLEKGRGLELLCWEL